jgi:ParB/RepB/Spo0J family partition protein
MKSNVILKDELELREILVAMLIDHEMNRNADHGLAFGELCESVREHGIVQPLVVRSVDAGYQILAGHRRRRAAVACGLEVVPCLIRHCSDEVAMAIMVVENFERLNLDLMEEAEAIEAAQMALGWSVEEVARKFSRSVEWVQLSLRLLDLPQAARKMVKGGEIRRDTLNVVLSLADGAERERAVQLCFWPGSQAVPLNGHQARQVVRAEITVPREERARWEKGREAARKKLMKDWKYVEGFEIMVPEYAWALEAISHDSGRWQVAGEYVPADLCQPGADRVTWAAVASVHGVPGVWLPIDGVGQPRLYVDRRLVTAGESARHAHGQETFFVFGQAAAKPVESGRSEGLEGEEDEPKNEGPPDRRTVTHDSGRTVTVSRDVLERVLAKFEECKNSRTLPYCEVEARMKGLPRALQEVMFEDGAAFVKWVLDGCSEE